MTAEGNTKARTRGSDPPGSVPGPRVGRLDSSYAELARLAAAVCAAEYATLRLSGVELGWDSVGQRELAIWPPPDSRACSPAAPDAVVECIDGEPLAIEGTDIHSRASCSVRTALGDDLGLLTVFRRAAEPLADAARESLRLVARQIAVQAELRTRLLELALTAPDGAARTAHSVLDSAPVALYHTDSTSKMTYVNSEYRRIFGLAPGELETDWSRIVHETDRAHIEEVWNDFCRDPRPVKFEYRLRSGDGGVRYVSERLVTAAGDVPGFVGTISDFTDLVTVRGDLRKAETLFIDTFDQAPIGIAYADRNGRFLRCNPAFCALLQLGNGDLGTHDSGDLTHPDDRHSSAAQLARLWTGDVKFVDVEKRYVRRDGAVVWVRATTTLVRGAGGTPECSVEFLRDIGERKQAALDLERVHKQLMTASRQAGMAEVATNVLHNVGNILNSVNISASLVAERVKQSRAPGLSRVAALLTEHAADLATFVTTDQRGRHLPDYLTSLAAQMTIDQQVTLQELASLRDNLEHIKDTVTMQQSYAKLCGVTETVSVADLVEDSLRLNAGAFVRHGVALQREFHEVPPITVDKHKVLQILVNLVRNAKYACDESGRTDKLVILRIEPLTDGVRISVVDNGVGILPENMGRLFSHGFTTRKSGHGFGLHSGAVAAQELGGTLRAASDGAGRGATFILDLPRLPKVADRA